MEQQQRAAAQHNRHPQLSPYSWHVAGAQAAASPHMRTVWCNFSPDHTSQCGTGQYAKGAAAGDSTAAWQAQLQGWAGLGWGWLGLAALGGQAVSS